MARRAHAHRLVLTRPPTRPSFPPSFHPSGHTLGDRNITVREDKAPTKSAPSKGGGNRSTLGDTPAAEGCRCYVGNLAWETTEESLIGTSPPPDSVFPRPRPARATARETPARDRPLARPRRQRRVLLLSFAPFGQGDRAVAIPGETRHTRFRR